MAQGCPIEFFAVILPQWHEIVHMRNETFVVMSLQHLICLSLILQNVANRISDFSRIRTGRAPQLLAACCNLAITLIHRPGSSHSHIAASRRSFSYHPRTAFDLCFPDPPPSNNSQTLGWQLTPIDLCRNVGKVGSSVRRCT